MIRVLFVIMSICQPLLLLTKAIDFGYMSRFVGMFDLGCSFLCSLVAIVGNNSKIDKSASFFLIIICLVVSLFKQQISYEAIVASLTFVSVLSCWLIYPALGDEGIKNIIKISYVVQAIILIGLSYTSVAHIATSSEEGKYYIESLTLGLNNPNQTAMTLFYVFIVLLYFYANLNKHFLKRLFYIVLMIALLVLIIETDSRTSTFVTICTVVFYFLSKFIKRYNLSNVVYNDIFKLVCLLSPIVFCFLYLYMFDNPYLMQIEIFDKPLYTGREVIYQEALQSIKENLLFGNVSLWKFTNMHNGILTLLMNIGLIGVILYYAFIFKMAKKIVAINKGTVQSKHILIIGFLFTYLIACSESATLISFFYYTLTLLVLIMEPKFEID